MLRLRRIAFDIFSSSAFNGRALSISTAAQNVESENPCQEVLAEGFGCSRKAILNRPFALNSLTTSTVTQLHKLYQAWEIHPDIGFVVMKGASDRAFCTGGDVVRLYQLANQGKLEECKDFFNKAYQFVYHVGTYLKPHVALLDGLTMGGGAGISIPGTFRVATDKTVFGTPETQIGFHPDAGASFFLSHLPGCLGEYLALTGEQLNGSEMVVAGLATHFSVSTRISWIEERLGTLVTNDPSVVETALDEYSDAVIPDSKSSLRRCATQKTPSTSGFMSKGKSTSHLPRSIGHTNGSCSCPHDNGCYQSLFLKGDC